MIHQLMRKSSRSFTFFYVVCCLYIRFLLAGLYALCARTITRDVLTYSQCKLSHDVDVRIVLFFDCFFFYMYIIGCSTFFPLFKSIFYSVFFFLLFTSLAVLFFCRFHFCCLFTSAVLPICVVFYCFDIKQPCKWKHKTKLKKQKNQHLFFLFFLFALEHSIDKRQESSASFKSQQVRKKKNQLQFD